MRNRISRTISRNLQRWFSLSNKLIKIKAEDLWLMLVIFWNLLAVNCSLENYSNDNNRDSHFLSDSGGVNSTLNFEKYYFGDHYLVMTLSTHSVCTAYLQWRHKNPCFLPIPQRKSRQNPQYVGCLFRDDNLILCGRVFIRLLYKIRPHFWATTAIFRYGRSLVPKDWNILF